MLEAFEPVFAEVVVTRNSTPRTLSSTSSPRSRRGLRRRPRPGRARLDDALEAAVTLAEEEGEFSGGGVLVTGSVITVGEARLLLGRG